MCRQPPGTHSPYPVLPSAPLFRSWSHLASLVTRGRIIFAPFFAPPVARLVVSAYLAGDRSSYAAIALVLALDFGRRAGLVPGGTRANLARWYSEVSARPSMAA